MWGIGGVDINADRQTDRHSSPVLPVLLHHTLEELTSAQPQQLDRVSTTFLSRL